MTLMNGIPGILLAGVCALFVTGVRADDKTGLIAGCAVGGAIILIIIIVLTIVCCRKRAKEEKKRKGDYEQFIEPSTLESQHQLSHSDSNVKLTNGYITNIHVNGYAKGINGNAFTKIERSRSDVIDQRRHVRPEWRRQQDQRDGNVINLNHSSVSDSLPAGIWTSNPTLTFGLSQPNVTAKATGSAGKITSPYHNSEPALHVHQSAKKQQRPRATRGNSNVNQSLAPLHEASSLTGSTDNHDKFKHHESKRVLNAIKDDKKELLPGTSSSDDTGSERDHRMVARAYSNHGFTSDSGTSSNTNITVLTDSRGISAANSTQSSNQSRSADSPFVAKVYSDYQLPRDFIRDPAKIARVYSCYSPEGHNARPSAQNSASTAVPVHSGHRVAKASVSLSSGSPDSNGEPKYAKPQDAIRHITHSDWILYSKPQINLIGRSYSNKEKGRFNQNRDAAGKKAQRSASHVTNRKAVPLADRVPEVDIRRGVYMRRNDNIQKQPRPQSFDSGKFSKEGSSNRSSFNSNAVVVVPDGNKSKERNIIKKSKSSKSDKKAKNKSNLSLKMPNAQDLKAKSAPLPDMPESPDRTTSPAPSIDSNVTPSLVRTISESSSVNADEKSENPTNELHHTPEVVCEPDAIYASPIKKRSVKSPTPNEIPDTPFSPVPPPIPPITKLRDEPLTPDTTLNPPVKTVQPVNTSSQITGSEEELPEHRPHSVASSRYRHTDGDGLSTGKSVIGDAFKFLEDFDDNMSFDGDDRL